MDLTPYRTFLVELAETSGAFILPYFGNADLTVELKSDKTPVTIADRGAEELMRAMIKRRFPDHGIIGEEFGSENASNEFVWVLDPIDGTQSFATACPLFGTLIALLHQGRPILGAIHQPVLRQLLIGDGASAALNGKPARVRPCAALKDAVILSTDILNVARYQNAERFHTVITQARLFRTWGDCYGYLLVATGWADAMCDPVMNPWDIAALVPIITGAGGRITDWSGGEPVKAASIIAAGPTLHPLLLKSLG